MRCFAFFCTQSSKSNRRSDQVPFRVSVASGGWWLPCWLARAYKWGVPCFKAAKTQTRAVPGHGRHINKNVSREGLFCNPWVNFSPRESWGVPLKTLFWRLRLSSPICLWLTLHRLLWLDFNKDGFIFSLLIWNAFVWAQVVIIFFQCCFYQPQFNFVPTL